jgi:hypothetical protein
MKMPMRWPMRLILAAAAAAGVVFAFNAIRRESIHAMKTSLVEASHQAPDYTLEQRAAVARQLAWEKHTPWRELSPEEIAAQIITLTSAAPTQPPPAEFLGNLTVINAPPLDMLGLSRQPDCSLTLEGGGYSVLDPQFTYTVESRTPNYGAVLHEEAGLTTATGKFKAGCDDQVLGVSSKVVIYAGKSKSGLKVFADAYYNGLTGQNDILTLTASGTDDSFVSSSNITGLNPVNLTAADLNKDGNPDLVVVNESVTGITPTTVSVLLGEDNGKFKAPVNYTLPGFAGESAVIDDFNGDGIPDIVVSSGKRGSNYISFLAGKGNGTFKDPVSFEVKPPAGSTLSASCYGLISADLRGNGKKDLVTGSGVIFLGNGNGAFTQSPTAVFGQGANSSYGPNVVAADFNKDGKLDLAFDNGEAISVYLGKGDGTFTQGAVYATIDNTGYIAATDLDGDGNIDIYSGASGPGMYGGDQFEFGQGYALMGNGNGTFHGAPVLPFVFTGLNLVNLNGDKYIDGVGLNETINSNNVSFTSYLGRGNGLFAAKSTLDVSTVKIDGTAYPTASINSFAFGDVRGDGKNDLFFLPTQFGGPMGRTGLFVALGNGEGSFGAPIFIPAPSFVAKGDDDYNEQLTNLWVADFNHDGKADILYNYFDQGYYSQTYYRGLAVQLGNGDGTFQPPKIIQTYTGKTYPGGLGPMTIQVGDANKDDFPDLLVLNFVGTTSGNSSTLYLYQGNGDGSFKAPTKPPVAETIQLPGFGAQAGQVVIADMNHDGIPDLVTLGTASTGAAQLAISLGKGDGGFGKPSTVDFALSGSLGLSLAVGDFNGDGKLDVAIGGFNPPFDNGIFLGNGDGTVQTFKSSGGLIEPAEAIYLPGFGAALAVDVNGDGKTGLVAGATVLVSKAPN